MLSPAELASMRATLLASLPDTAQVRRATRTSDGMGGTIDTWTTVATVACRVSPSHNTPTEQAIANQVRGRVLWTLTLPAGTSVRSDDRVLVGSRTFEVLGVLAPRSYELATRIVAVEA
jgi:head-tail adaptor